MPQTSKPHLLFSFKHNQPETSIHHELVENNEGFPVQTHTFIGGGCWRKAAAEASVELLGPELAPDECRDSGFGCKSRVTGITGTEANVAVLRFCGKTWSDRSRQG